MLPSPRIGRSPCCGGSLDHQGIVIIIQPVALFRCSRVEDIVGIVTINAQVVYPS